MTDTETPIRCPFCGGTELIRTEAMIATIIDIDSPENPPREVETKTFSCFGCGRDFNELETWD